MKNKKSLGKDIIEGLQEAIEYEKGNNSDDPIPIPKRKIKCTLHKYSDKKDYEHLWGVLKASLELFKLVGGEDLTLPIKKIIEHVEALEKNEELK